MPPHSPGAPPDPLELEALELLEVLEALELLEVLEVLLEVVWLVSAPPAPPALLVDDEPPASLVEPTSSALAQPTPKIGKNKLKPRMKRILFASRYGSSLDLLATSADCHEIVHSPSAASSAGKNRLFGRRFRSGAEAGALGGEIDAAAVA